MGYKPGLREKGCPEDTKKQVSCGAGGFGGFILFIFGGVHFIHPMPITTMFVESNGSQVQQALSLTPATPGHGDLGHVPYPLWSCFPVSTPAPNSLDLREGQRSLS